MLVRFVAVGLIGWAVADISLYVVVCQHKALPVAPLACVLKSLPFVIGVVVLIKARAIAEWLAEQLDL